MELSELPFREEPAGEPFAVSSLSLTMAAKAPYWYIYSPNAAGDASAAVSVAAHLTDESIEER
jgi:hypothetical protein